MVISRLGRFTLLVAGALVALSVYASPAAGQVVSPLQTGHYTPAAQNVRDMSNPIPGLFPIWYNMYAWGDTYIDMDGNEFKNLNQLLPNLDVDVSLDLKTFATIPMVFWASDDIGPLGGAKYMGGFSLNYVVADGSVVTERQAVIGDTTITQSFDGSLSGFSDLFVVPLGLSWHWEHFDLTSLYGFAAPTGRYEAGADDNLGLGFWTHQLQAFGYYYPVAEQSTAIMFGLTYELNSDIKDGDVKPGSRLSLDYGVSQYLSSRFEVAVQGGNNWQVSDDTGDGVYWDPTKHDRKSTLAFYGNYWPWEGRLAVSLKYGFDYGARGRFVTDYLMLNILFIPNILTGK